MCGPPLHFQVFTALKIIKSKIGAGVAVKTLPVKEQFPFLFLIGNRYTRCWCADYRSQPKVHVQARKETIPAGRDTCKGIRFWLQLYSSVAQEVASYH